MMTELPLISSAMLVLTHACNLRCRYCFVDKKPEYMTYETALDAAQFLIRNAEASGKTPDINFFGGEPMLMWDSIIVPLTNWIRQEYGKPFTLSMTTNATLLNKKRIQFMKDNNIGFLLSADGTQATQDYNRPKANGGGSFEEASRWYQDLLAYRPSSLFRMTCIPPTCGNLYEDIRFAESQGFKSFFTVPNVFEEWDEEHRAIVEEQMCQYGDYYIDCFRHGTKPIKFSTMEDAFNEINLINMAGRKGEYRTSNKCKACGKCGLGASRFASVHPNGNVYACQEMTSNAGEENIFYIGNIYTGIQDERRTALMALYDSQVASGTNCGSCLYNNICDGGCVANNYMITGSVSKVPDVYCWWKQVVLGQAIRIMQTLGQESNVLFAEKWSALCQRK